MRVTIQRKNYRIDVSKLKRTQKLLGARTETETIHRALDLAADEIELAKALGELVREAHGQIEDVNEG